MEKYLGAYKSPVNSEDVYGFYSGDRKYSDVPAYTDEAKKYAEESKKYAEISLVASDTATSSKNLAEQAAEEAVQTSKDVQEDVDLISDTAITVSEQSILATDAAKYSNEWAVKMDGMVTGDNNTDDYSSKQYATNSKDSSNTSSSSATEAKKSAKISREWAIQAEEVDDGINSKDWSSKTYAERSKASAVDSKEYSDTSHEWAEKSISSSQEAKKSADEASESADSIDLTHYMRNDITSVPTNRIYGSEWYGDIGVGTPVMCKPGSYGVPVDGFHTMLKLGARDQQKGSSWLHMPYVFNTNITDGNIYFGATQDSTVAPTWRKMLHDGCSTLVGQLPSTSINLTNTETHLDTLKNKGLYHQDYTSGATTENGYPFHSAGSLQVIQSAGITQVYTEYQAPFRVARRSYVQGKWSAWFIDTVTWEYKGTAMQGEEVALNDAFGTPIFEDNAFGLSYYLTLMVGYASATSFQEVHVVNFLFTGSSIFNTSTSGIYLQYVNGTAVIEIMLKGVVVGTHLKYIVNLKEIGHSTTPSLNNKNATNNNTIKTLEFNENKQEKEDDESINDITAISSIGRM